MHFKGQRREIQKHIEGVLDTVVPGRSLIDASIIRDIRKGYGQQLEHAGELMKAESVEQNSQRVDAMCEAMEGTQISLRQLLTAKKIAGIDPLFNGGQLENAVDNLASVAIETYLENNPTILEELLAIAEENAETEDIRLAQSAGEDRYAQILIERYLEDIIRDSSEYKECIERLSKPLFTRRSGHLPRPPNNDNVGPEKRL